MSLISDTIDKNPSRAKRLIGIDAQPLEQLINEAELAHKQLELENNESKKRVNAPGGGRTSKLSIRDEGTHLRRDIITLRLAVETAATRTKSAVADFQNP